MWKKHLCNYVNSYKTYEKNVVYSGLERVII